MSSWLGTAVDWIVGLVREWGYGGIFVMMAVESSFVPFPSEVALIPAGYLAAQGEMSPWLAILAGLAGSLVGAFTNYGLARYLGRPFLRVVEGIDRWLPGKGSGLERAEHYFERHGEITTFVGRLIPAIRQLISIPAGLARMPLWRFGFYTGLGAGLWSAVLVGVGYAAGENEELWRPLLQRYTVWLVLGAVALVAVYVGIQRRRSRST